MKKGNAKCLTSHTLGSEINHTWILKLLSLFIVLIARLEYLSAGMVFVFCVCLFFVSFCHVLVSTICCAYLATNENPDLRGQVLLSCEYWESLNKSQPVPVMQTARFLLENRQHQLFYGLYSKRLRMRPRPSKLAVPVYCSSCLKWW